MHFLIQVQSALTIVLVDHRGWILWRTLEVEPRTIRPFGPHKINLLWNRAVGMQYGEGGNHGQSMSATKSEQLL